ncbi:MAG: class I SAM-dependent methyltransferase [Planctomycetes bacterium]|nr:class I SAM-dependent methyltransferase [Planctomycetota bacterium]
MPKDPKERFTAAADNYDRWRPSYPAALLAWLLATTGSGPGTRVADVGCGTGISTRLLAERGLEVVGIDPNDAMLEYARRAGGAARYQKGNCDATGLPDASVHLVLAAQAFHWFEPAAALREFRRIAPAGWAAAIWNVRARSPFLAAYEALLRSASGEYDALPKAEETLAAIRALVPQVVEGEFPSRQAFDREGLRGRAWSSSYVVHGVGDAAAFDAALDALFDGHQVDGRIEFLYRSVGIAWRLGT